MKTNELTRSIAVGVLWLSLTAGCREDPSLAACKNGSCCWTGTNPKFIKRLNNAPADFDSYAFSFKETLAVANGYILHGATVCNVQWDMLEAMKLKSSVNIDPKTNKVRLIDSTRQYPYRVWGIVYELPEITNFGPIPTLSVRIEKVEEAK